MRVGQYESFPNSVFHAINDHSVIKCLDNRCVGKINPLSYMRFIVADQIVSVDFNGGMTCFLPSRNFPSLGHRNQC